MTMLSLVNYSLWNPVVAGGHDLLLPPSSTELERALDRAAARFSTAGIVPTIWNVDTCPMYILPFLAWAVSVDEWDPLWSENRKRDAVRAAREIHRRKGTPTAIRRVLETVGQNDATLVERSDYIRCDGTTLVDGSRTCGGQWATFRIVLTQPVTIADAYLIKRLLISSKRNCVHLESIDFSAAAFRCDGSFACDGSVSCGTVDTTLN